MVARLLSLDDDRPLSQLIECMQISKQAAGQLVDTLVERGYLQRVVDAQDRRRLTLALSQRGRVAAKVQTAARVRIAAELVARAGR